MIVEANVENLKLINNYIEDILNEMDVPMKTIYSIKVAFEEIFVNICLYAYDDSNRTIKVIIELDRNEINIQLEDSGIPYNPLEKEDPDINAPVEERSIGGLGIFMVKKMLDSFDYKFKDGKNINILIKSLG